VVLELVVTKTDDGFTAEISSIKGCECWAHTEDEVLDKIQDLALFYLNKDDRKAFKLDKARGDFTFSVYKLIIK
jgi:predicted RNase H-like HicB family nuclease